MTYERHHHIDDDVARDSAAAGILPLAVAVAAIVAGIVIYQLAYSDATQTATGTPTTMEKIGTPAGTTGSGAAR
jgi:hypothetical protein